MDIDTRFVRRISLRPGAAVADGQWPYTLEPVRQLLGDGLSLPAGVTYLVGENGSGKSTIIEALASAYGLGPEGGSRGADHATRPSKSSLGSALQLTRGVGGSQWSFFLRAETMHGFYTYLERNPGRGNEPVFHEMSHGEGFLEVLRTRFERPGLYLLDEPESALSFSSCLALAGLLHELAGAGAQIVCATHSPLLTALPGATIFELDDTGIHARAWEELALVDHWKRYLQTPQAYLRHIL